MTPLLLAGSLQRSLDRGHGVRRVDEREGAQAEGVCHEAGEDVGAPLPLRALVSGSTTRSSRAATRELPLACFKSTRYCASLSSIWTGRVPAVATVPPMTPRAVGASI